ncbi:aflatoxin biosynthesis ketoreductase nor-1 [Stachybotrys elegans]|uniref:Aflatoxin biosynthesis ketoreductase nor-1 n=1 Tax=Stachybotrys elegans TaxID=80388 RepID=A0A8K0SEZ0_9HYPO|nr:aflatoxin biosynthesis ketoreductase nor-1 [Stachybotrys elegans]
MAVVYISGVSKGIGRELARRYLERPDHIVVGSIRDDTTPEVETLKNTVPASGSKLILVHNECTNPDDTKKAFDDVVASGINHFDIIIANAGGSPNVKPLDVVGPDDMIYDFQVNAVAPLVLFQTFKPLLEKSTKSPKWISVTTAGGSISLMETVRSWVGPAYGASKAALNWITCAIHFENKWLTAVAIHPGLVQTGPGNWVARTFGNLPMAPVTIEHCVDRMLDIIDNATREETSGKYIRSTDGTEMTW